MMVTSAETPVTTASAATAGWVLVTLVSNRETESIGTTNRLVESIWTRLRSRWRPVPDMNRAVESTLQSMSTKMLPSRACTLR
jgi:hypothetical protein